MSKLRNWKIKIANYNKLQVREVWHDQQWWNTDSGINCILFKRLVGPLANNAIMMIQMKWLKSSAHDFEIFCTWLFINRRYLIIKQNQTIYFKNITWNQQYRLSGVKEHITIRASPGFYLNWITIGWILCRRIYITLQQWTPLFSILIACTSTSVVTVSIFCCSSVGIVLNLVLAPDHLQGF